MKSFGRFATFFILAMALLFVDFYTKAYVFSFLPHNLDVFQNRGGIDFSITLAMNKGAAWGIFANFQHLILALRIVVIVILIGYLFLGSERWGKKIPLVLIVTGAIGNVIDFFLYGSVIDFLRFNLWGYPFPVFNVADILITGGVICFFLHSLFLKKKVTHAT